ncbi:hypothetical protein [Sunxiuqinia sp. sy24]|uniref:hypothetical protein n=1 Tax=Sunxiuqinia sp. sy24 TaxID=3461495 RepID=UPI0040451F99
MKRIGVLVMVMLGMIALGQAQTADEFKPTGKPVMRIFSNYHSTFSDGESASAFELTRVYLGYQHQFSNELSGTVIFDVADPGVGGLKMAAYVKNAYLKYHTGNFTANFGMIATTQFKVQESAWGYRYLYKSLQDEHKYNASADLGVSLAYKFSDFVSADVIMSNGEGYKKVQADSTFRTGFGVTIHPVKKLTGRVYYDFISKENTQSSLATFVGYKADDFSLGAEYNQQYNAGFKEDHDLSGTSFYGTWNASSKIKVFARYDKLFSNALAGSSSDWNRSKDGQLFLAGLEFTPVKGVKLAPNFQGWSPADDSKDFSASLFLNCEIKF